tara:strand:- start:60125 stop:60706 length:582 start_codon:yes stop_codon:yes gene_type:complete
MSCFLFTDDSDKIENVNIDELYEKRQQRDLRQVSIFNKILNRIHKRIKVTGRNKTNEQHIWFTIPEYIFGEPVYNKADCIAYIIAKLEANKFHIRYIHPNTIFVSWSNWVPSYVRSEYKKRTGVTVDELGQVVSNKNELIEDKDDPNAKILNTGAEQSNDKPKKIYNSTENYIPSGKLIYNPDMFNHIEKKVN